MAGRRSYSKKPSASAKKKDMFEEPTRNVLKAITDMMENGGLPPWSKGHADSIGVSSPSNFNTGKAYRGINRINLFCVGAMTGSDSGYYVTYNQSLNIAGVDRKDPDVAKKSPLSGEKAVARVTYWGNTTKDKDGKPWFVIENGKKRTSPTQKEIKEQQLKQIWFLRDTPVFAFEQLDKEKIPEAWLEKRNMIEKHSIKMVLT